MIAPQVRLWIVASVLAGAGCDSVLGVDLCGKTCDSDSQCTDGYTCSGGVCVSPRCPGASDAAVISSSQGGSSTSAPASSGPGSSSSAPASSSSAPPSSGPADGGVDPCLGADAGAPCGAGLLCLATGCAPACLIDGNITMPGLDPANDCRTCDPTQSTTAWSNLGMGTLCDDGDACTDPDTCDGSGVCSGTAACPATAPMCNAGTCSCTTTPADTCAAGTTNRVCRSGMCGCNTSTDCAAGETCSAGNQCVACNTASSCGDTCADCRTLPMTLGEGSYYQCMGSTAPLATACVVTACAAARADCNGVDSDACEVDLMTSAMHCGGCGVGCLGTPCSGGQCDCNPEACPLTQMCQGQSCRCTNSTQCAPGYMCSGMRCVR